MASFFDRHITLNAGWIAGPAAGAVLMAIPPYLGLDRAVAGIVVWSGAAVFLCSILAVVAHWLKGRRPERMIVGPALLAGAGLLAICAAGAWRFWPQSAKTVVANAAKAEAPVQKDAQPDLRLQVASDRAAALYGRGQSAPAQVALAAAPAVGLDKTVSLVCDRSAVPLKGREDKSIDIVQIVSFPSSGSASPAYRDLANTRIAQGSTEINWPKDYDGMVLKCTLVNYGNVPLFAVTGDAQVTWLAQVPSPNGTRAGPILLQKTWRTPTIDLGVGVDGKDYFYFLYERGDAFIKIDPPTSISFRLASGQEFHGVPLIAPSQILSIVLFPKVKTPE